MKVKLFYHLSNVTESAVIIVFGCHLADSSKA